MSVPVSPHYALLIDAIDPSGPHRASISGWSAEDWAATSRAAEWHRLGPRLFHNLATLDDVPDEILGDFKSQYLTNSARSLFIAGALDNALGAFSRAGIAAMPLKGAALLQDVYAADPAQREMTDIDLLVATEHLDRAAAVLADDLGYTPHEDPTDRAEHHHDRAMVAPGGLVAIELHFHIAAPDERARFDVADLWRRAAPLPDRAPHVLPCAEDLLLHLCIHFTRDRMGGHHERHGTGGALSQLCDITHLITHRTLDWDAVIATARGYGLDGRVHLALGALAELGLPTAPDDVLAQGASPDLARQLLRLRVLRDGARMPVRSVRWMVSPPREVLESAWQAEPQRRGSLARAYVRRAVAQLPHARAALRRPLDVVRDYRLNGRVSRLDRPSRTTRGAR
jgi:hypothetical protein